MFQINLSAEKGVLSSKSSHNRFRVIRNNLKGLTDLFLKHVSSQGQHLAVTVLFVLNSLESRNRNRVSSSADVLLSSLELSDAKVYEP